MAEMILRPNSDDHRSDVAIVNGSTMYGVMDEAVLDIGDYIRADIRTMGSFVCGFEQSGLPPATVINSVTFYYNTLNNATDFLHKYRLSGGGYNLPSVEISLVSGTLYRIVLTENPETGMAWTVSDVDSMCHGGLIVMPDKGSSTYVYQFYAVVDYTAPLISKRRTLTLTGCGQ